MATHDELPRGGHRQGGDAGEHERLEPSGAEGPGDAAARSTVRSATSEPAARFGRFVIVHTPDPAQLGRVLPVSRESIVFGRDEAGAGCVIADRSLSRVHARSTWDERGQSLRLTDAGSRNGTFVGCLRVESGLVVHGDVVRLGDTLLVYQEESPMERLVAAAQALARSDVPVLIRGETGAGKDWLARELHDRSGRAGRFVSVRCASMAHESFARELFGESDALGQAGAQASGLSGGALGGQRAAGGTLYLDEVGEASEGLQAALVCLLDAQDDARRRGDASQLAPRLLASTELDLGQAVAQRRFRRDLLDGLARVQLDVPPLRERRHELLVLAHALARADGYTLKLTTDAAEALLSYAFPYNLRELRTLLRAFFALRGPRSELDVGYLAERHPEVAEPALRRRQGASTGLPSSAPTRPLVPTLPGADPARLRALLEAHGGDITEVARVLGKPRSQVFRMLEALGLKPERQRRG